MPEKPIVPIEDHEYAIPIGSVFLVFPKGNCDYIRFVDRHSLAEIVKWISDEWRDEPEAVMGTLMGMLNNPDEGRKRLTNPY